MENAEVPKDQAEFVNYVAVPDLRDQETLKLICGGAMAMTRVSNLPPFMQLAYQNLAYAASVVCSFLAAEELSRTLEERTDDG